MSTFCLVMNGYKCRTCFVGVSEALPAMSNLPPQSTTATDCDLLAESGSSFATSFIVLCFVIFCGLLLIYLWPSGNVWFWFGVAVRLNVYVFSDRVPSRENSSKS